MEVQIKFKVNDSIYLKDPESSEIGRRIVKESIDIIYELGFEDFTFKKLAQRINITEATVYRYFSSKYKLLLYILNWYWHYLEFLAQMSLAEVNNPKEKLMVVLEIITNNYKTGTKIQDYNIDFLNKIVISESSKTYFVKNVDDINKNQAFKPFKDLCAFMASIITECKPDYLYPKSLASTLIETSHDQQFFSEHLPKLTDNENKSHSQYVLMYLKDLIQKIITD